MYAVNVQIDNEFLIHMGGEVFRASAVSPIFETREEAHWYAKAINKMKDNNATHVWPIEYAMGSCCDVIKPRRLSFT